MLWFPFADAETRGLRAQISVALQNNGSVLLTGAGSVQFLLRSQHAGRCGYDVSSASASPSNSFVSFATSTHVFLSGAQLGPWTTISAQSSSQLTLSFGAAVRTTGLTITNALANVDNALTLASASLDSSAQLVLTSKGSVTVSGGDFVMRAGALLKGQPQSTVVIAADARFVATDYGYSEPARIEALTMVNFGTAALTIVNLNSKAVLDNRGTLSFAVAGRSGIATAEALSWNGGRVVNVGSVAVSSAATPSMSVSWEQTGGTFAIDAGCTLSFTSSARLQTGVLWTGPGRLQLGQRTECRTALSNADGVLDVPYSGELDTSLPIVAGELSLAGRLTGNASVQIMRKFTFGGTLQLTGSAEVSVVSGTLGFTSGWKLTGGTVRVGSAVTATMPDYAYGTWAAARIVVAGLLDIRRYSYLTVQGGSVLEVAAGGEISAGASGATFGGSSPSDLRITLAATSRLSVLWGASLSLVATVENRGTACARGVWLR
jgi:hypothetical protein